MWRVVRFPPATHPVVHCKTKAQAQYVLRAIAERMAQVGLELHPDKTRIVYCKDDHRPLSHEHERFDFLGYTFRPRLSKSKDDHYFVNFSRSRERPWVPARR